MFLGITLAVMGEKGKPLMEFFICLSEAMMTITTWVIYMAPVGVFFLIGGQVRTHHMFSRIRNFLFLFCFEKKTNVFSIRITVGSVVRSWTPVTLKVVNPTKSSWTYHIRLHSDDQMVRADVYECM